MSAATERALQRRVVLLEKRLAILTARFEMMDKAAALMGGGSVDIENCETAKTNIHPRPRHLRVVR